MKLNSQLRVEEFNLEWIAKGSATDGPVLNLAADEVEFMDI